MVVVAEPTSKTFLVIDGMRHLLSISKLFLTKTLKRKDVSARTTLLFYEHSVFSVSFSLLMIFLSSALY